MASPFGSIYNPENVFVSTEGGGAGNNWALGYAQGCTVQDGIMDMLDREADSSDSLEVLCSQTAPYRASCFATRLPVGRARDLDRCSWSGCETALGAS